MTGSPSLAQEFQQRFGAQPRWFRAPARVNLIGEHTDYNDGYVLPAAIGFFVNVAIAPRAEPVLRVHSMHFGQTVVLDLAVLQQGGVPADLPPWSRYVAGVASLLLREGVRLTGADVLIGSDVPLGSGLSSSAALEVALALAFSVTAGAAVAPRRLAQLCQSAEHEFAGTRCGIMDQFASALGRADHALLLDCRSLEYDWIPLAGLARSTRWLVCDTRVHHEHAGGEYNVRRAQCEEAVRVLAPWTAICSLRDLTREQLQANAGRLEPLLQRRCCHVVSENARVLEAAEALRAGDAARFGDCMRRSHQSMRDDYEISCPEVDVMVELASRIDGVFGARMTGGGFGGCTINLVRADAVPRFRQQLAGGYERATGISPRLYECAIVDGAAAVPHGPAATPHGAAGEG